MLNLHTGLDRFDPVTQGLKRPSFLPHPRWRIYIEYIVGSISALWPILMALTTNRKVVSFKKEHYHTSQNK